MFTPINSLLKRADSKIHRPLLDTEPLQPITTTGSSAISAPRPQLSVTTNLPNTADRVQQIHNNMASNTRAEFASVIEQLNASQGRN